MNTKDEVKRAVCLTTHREVYDGVAVGDAVKVVVQRNARGEAMSEPRVCRYAGRKGVVTMRSSKGLAVELATGHEILVQREDIVRVE